MNMFVKDQTAAPIVKGSELEAYFRKARSFELDRLIAAQRSVKVAWITAGFACVIAFVAVLAVCIMTPLKTVVPLVFRVENSTGIVENITSVVDGKWTGDEAVTKASAARYVRSREGYALNEAEENFRVVSAFSAPEEQDRFASFYSGRNPESPQNVYGRTGISRVTIKSVSIPNKSLVQVRFLKEVRIGDDRKVSHWIATLSFGNADRKKMKEQTLLINPTGFVVTDYRVDPEAVQ
ncbi:virB8 family protein [Microvirga puerhi]|uniref:Type IV secretion system protein virB8 n=1 Tax=Microvirga puerhi TaxID=2876078 RepID=A0ABS7VTF0_9HYPH|nr:virB8 family protein [Microvirga puerhi]MBZ6078842.1 virB8 family protein [Microvirga puerhi]